MHKFYCSSQCCKSKCPARIWLYHSGVCIFSPNHKHHNHSDNAEDEVKINQAMSKSKKEVSALKLENGRLPTIDEIFRKNITE